MPPTHLDPGALLMFTQHVLEDAGMEPNDAGVAAETMVGADARGQHTHGVWYLGPSVAGLRGGGINPRPHIRVVRRTTATAVLDGDGGLGGLVAVRASELAAEMAHEAGCATVLVRGSNHFGAASCYSLLLAERGCIGIVASNARPIMVAPGGRHPVLGAHPLSYAVPDPDGQGAVMLDMALSATAATRVVQAHAAGEPVPEGWIVDAEGRPTTDPGALMAGGALLPIAGPKGYGLAVLIEILAGALSGANMTGEVRSQDPEHPSGTGHCVIALSVDAFMDGDAFGERVGRLRTEVHDAAGSAEGSRLPGEGAAASAAAAELEGIALDEVVWQALVAVADDVGRRAELEAARRS